MSRQPVFEVRQLMWLTGMDCTRERSHAAVEGLMLSILSERSQAGDHTVEGFVSGVGRGAALDQIQVFFDVFGRYCGHVVWTRAPGRVDDAALKLRPAHWLSGTFGNTGNVVVLDFLAVYGSLKAILQHIGETWGRGGGCITYSRVKGEDRVVKVATTQQITALSGKRATSAGNEKEAFLESDTGKSFRAAAVAVLENAIAIGYVIRLLSGLRDYAEMDIWSLCRRLQNAIITSQYRMYFSADGRLIGFCSWAWRSETAFFDRRYLPLERMETSEWNEGKELFLCDAVATGEGADRVMGEIVTTLSAAKPFFIYPKERYGACHPRLISPRSRGRCINSKTWHRGANDLASALLREA